MSTKKQEPTRTLEDTIKLINKAKGDGTLMWLGDNIPKVRADVIPTKSAALNKALGVGGLPRGRIIEIYGVEHGGKTSLCIGAIANAQTMGHKAAYIDPECGLTIEDAETQGVDIKNLLYSQPRCGEDALDVAEALIKTGEIPIIVIDSVAALVPKRELEGEMGDLHIGLQARLMSQAMRKLTWLVAEHNVCLIFINQIREKVGVMHGSPETTSGGRALRFYASVRIDVRKRDQIKDGDNVIGHILYCKIVKNRVAPPHKKAYFTVIYGEGVDFAQELFDLGEDDGLIKKAGAWITILNPDTGQPEVGDDGKPVKFQGKEALRQALNDNLGLKQKLFDRFQEKLKKQMEKIQAVDEDDSYELTDNDVPEPGAIMAEVS